MLKFFQMTFFLLNLILFQPLSYASHDDRGPAGDAGADSPSFVAVLAAEPDAAQQDRVVAHKDQIEEGWRWRQNLDVTVSEGDQNCFIDGQGIHRQLCGREVALRGLGDSNIACAAITVVFQKSNAIQRKTAWIQNISDMMHSNALILGTSPYVFISHEVNQRRLGSPQQNSTFQRFNSESMRDHLLSFFDPVRQDIFQNLLEILISPTESIGFPQDWHHSEQKIIWFLWHCREISAYVDSQLHQTIDALLQQEDGVDISSLKAVVLHVHTKKDPCQRCAAALKILASKAQAGLRALQDENSNCRFLVTVSGREAYSSSRTTRGHDGGYGNPIQINLARAAQDSVSVNFQTSLAAPNPAQAPEYRLLQQGF